MTPLHVYDITRLVAPYEERVNWMGANVYHYSPKYKDSLYINIDSNLSLYFAI